jgi:hypothetical protein
MVRFNAAVARCVIIVVLLWGPFQSNGWAQRGAPPSAPRAGQATQVRETASSTFDSLESVLVIRKPDKARWEELLRLVGLAPWSESMWRMVAADGEAASKRVLLF